MYVRPYMLFSTHTPYSSHRLPSASDTRRTRRPCLATNLSCLAAESRDAPTTAAPAAAKSAIFSLNPIASFVQPGVSSFG